MFNLCILCSPKSHSYIWEETCHWLKCILYKQWQTYAVYFHTYSFTGFSRKSYYIARLVQNANRNICHVVSVNSGPCTFCLLFWTEQFSDDISLYCTASGNCITVIINYCFFAMVLGCGQTRTGIVPWHRHPPSTNTGAPIEKKKKSQSCIITVNVFVTTQTQQYCSL